jgi:hypothetical protein
LRRPGKVALVVGASLFHEGLVIDARCGGNTCLYFIFIYPTLWVVDVEDLLPQIWLEQRQ